MDRDPLPDSGRDLGDVTTIIRRPILSNKFYSKTTAEWLSLDYRLLRRSSLIGLIEETEYGYLDTETPCRNCCDRKTECRRFTKVAQQQLLREYPIAKPATCSRCRQHKRACDVAVSTPETENQSHRSLETDTDHKSCKEVGTRREHRKNPAKRVLSDEEDDMPLKALSQTREVSTSEYRTGGNIGYPKGEGQDTSVFQARAASPQTISAKATRSCTGDMSYHNSDRSFSRHSAVPPTNGERFGCSETISREPALDSQAAHFLILSGDEHRAEKSTMEIWLNDKNDCLLSAKHFAKYQLANLRRFESLKDEISQQYASMQKDHSMQLKELTEVYEASLADAKQEIRKIRKQSRTSLAALPTRAAYGED